MLLATIKHFPDLDSLKYFNGAEKYFILKRVLRVPQKPVTNNKLTEKEINIMSGSKTMQINYMGFIFSNYELEKYSRKPDGTCFACFQNIHGCVVVVVVDGSHLKKEQVSSIPTIVFFLSTVITITHVPKLLQRHTELLPTCTVLIGSLQ